MVFKRIFKKRSSSRRNSNTQSTIIRSTHGTKRGSCINLDRYNEPTPLDFQRPAKVETVTTIADDGDEYGYYYDHVSDSEMMSRNRTNSSNNCTTMGDYWPGATVYMFPEEWKERTGSRCCNERRDYNRGNKNHTNNTNEEMIDGSLMIVEDEDRHDNNTSGGNGGYDITLAVDEELYKSNNNNNNNHTNNEQSSSVWLSCLSCV